MPDQPRRRGAAAADRHRVAAAAALRMDAIGYVIVIAIVMTLAAVMTTPRMGTRRDTVTDDEPDAETGDLPTGIH